MGSPVLSPRKYHALRDGDQGYQVKKFSINYRPQEMGLKEALLKLCDEVEKSIRDGISIVILSDSDIDQGKQPIHSLLATGAVHHRLIDQGLRCDANIVVSTAYARDPHQIATLIGYGASVVYPYMSYHILCDLIETGELLCDTTTAFTNYRKGINKGLLKILSKMGISTIASYRGAQLYEIVGLADEVVELCFKDTPSRIKGADFSDIEEDQSGLAKDAWSSRKPVNPGGLLKYVHGQEYHAFNPDVIAALHDSVQHNDYAAWHKYAELVNKRPVATLRDLLTIKKGIEPVSLQEVEPVSDIISRFDSAGMSLGALSPEAHEALAEAMNTLGEGRIPVRVVKMLPVMAPSRFPRSSR